MPMQYPTQLVTSSECLTPHAGSNGPFSLGKLKESMSEQDDQGNVIMMCRNHGVLETKGCLHCPYCGSTMEPKVTKTCPKCTTKAIDDKQKFCHKCGEGMVDPIEYADELARKKSNTFRSEKSAAVEGYPLRDMRFWKDLGPTETNPHIVGVSIQVHFISAVSTVDQTFDCGFSLSYEWQPTASDIVEWENLEHDRKNEFNPDYIPQFKFANATAVEMNENTQYLDGSTYSMLKRGQLDTRGALVDMQQEYIIAARKEVRATFGEPFELHNFPFDVQELKVVIVSAATAERQILVPHFRRSSFVKIAMDVNSLPEWDLETPIMEFSLSDKQKSARGLAFSKATLNLKVSRKFWPYIVRIMSLMSIISLSIFTVFTMDPEEDQADRLANSFTLVLTGLVFMFVVESRLPAVAYLTLLDQYVYGLFILMMIISLESSLISFATDPAKVDRIFMIICGGLFLLIQVYFPMKSYLSRRNEKVKLGLTSQEALNQGYADKPESKTIKLTGERTIAGKRSPIGNYWGDDKVNTSPTHERTHSDD